MDIVLDTADHYVLDGVYPEWLARDNIVRQTLSLLAIVNIGGVFMYLIPTTLSYYTLFDHRLMRHPQYIPNQVSLEIWYALKSIPFMSLPTCFMFMLEVRGYGKLYDKVSDSPFGWYAIVSSVVTFILFTDMCIYWIHRGLHHKTIYKHIHKDHHKWKVPTPFASHAFHPIDGFVQSCPYHIYPFLFPLHKLVYLTLFIFVNVWTVSIHDGDFRVPAAIKPFVNGSAHHTDHHLFYNYNYGQFFTLWDKLGGSYRNPSAFEKDGPLDHILKNEKSNGHISSNGKKME